MVVVFTVSLPISPTKIQIYANGIKIDYVGNFACEEQANKAIDDILEEDTYRADKKPIDRKLFVVNESEYEDESDIYTLFVCSHDYVNKFEVIGVLGIYSSLQDVTDRLLYDEPGNYQKPRHKGYFETNSTEPKNPYRNNSYKPKVVTCVDMLQNPNNRNNMFGENVYYSHFEIYKSRFKNKN
jgi:hypothetical protein